MAIIELKGKVALVTGSARRVGKAIALALAAEGMHLVIHHANSDADAEQTAQEVRAYGVEALVTRADLRQPDEIRQMFDAIRERFGQLGLRLLVNNASAFLLGDIANISLDEWHEELDITLTAPFLCSQLAARLMRERGEGGAIINIADMSAYQPMRTYPQHSVAKAGMVMLTEVLALSLAPDIRVNGIAPGPVLRDDASSAERWRQFGERLPMRRTGDPADVTQAVIFMATQPFIIGTMLYVNGGEHLV